MKQPIAFLDSGVGGISILIEAVRLMPCEDFIYFGDSANAPYGTKPRELICSITEKNVQRLLTKGAKCIVIACNTATGACAKRLRLQYPQLPIVGIEPALKPAVLHNQGGKVLVMATPLTLQQPKFLKLMALYDTQAQIQLLPCAGLMEFVESGILQGEALTAFLHAKIDPINDGTIKAVVLGCTHYPFVKKAILEVIGYPTEIDDGALGTAEEIKRRLKKFACTTQSTTRGEVVFLNSGSANMIELSQTLFSLPN